MVKPVSYTHLDVYKRQVVRELKNENIDVIQWSKNSEILVRRALGNVTINKVEINEADTYALVYTPVEEISKVIGKQGQNIRLASWLSGYEIDVYREKQADDDVELGEFDDEIEAWVIAEFKKVGLDTAKSVLDKDTEAPVSYTHLDVYKRQMQYFDQNYCKINQCF